MRKRVGIEGFAPPSLATRPGNREALAALKARMFKQGEFRMQRNIDALVELVVGVKP